MQFFEYNAETGLPQFDPIVFELKPFKVLVDRDKSKNKEVAKAELCFIWMWCDYKSDFSSIINEEVKLKEILNIITLPEKWKIDTKVQDGITFYKELVKTVSTVLLEKTKKVITKLSDFLEEIDFTQMDSSGRLVFDMKKVVDTTTQIPKLLATLKEIEIRVMEEQANLEKQIRGNKELAVWEDGIDDV